MAGRDVRVYGGTSIVRVYAATAAQVRLRWLPNATALANWNGACLADWHATGSVQEDVRDE
jgi:hypothetical protein